MGEGVRPASGEDRNRWIGEVVRNKAGRQVARTEIDKAAVRIQIQVVRSVEIPPRGPEQRNDSVVDLFEIEDLHAWPGVGHVVGIVLVHTDVTRQTGSISELGDDDG